MGSEKDIIITTDLQYPIIVLYTLKLILQNESAFFDEIS
jgi:hypothetical protein